MFRDSRVALAGLWLVVLSGIVTGCGIVDQYGSRALTYNVEAEQAQNQAVLLNIVRSYKRYPMQFTALGSVQANSSVQGGISLSIPFGGRVSGSDVLSANPSGSAGISSFQVTPLDSGDFATQILRPIQEGTFDLYLQAGYPREVLFDLFIDKILIKRADGACALNNSARCEITFRNHVGNDFDFDLFQAMVEQLLHLGLTTAQTSTPGTTALRHNFCFAPSEPLHGEYIDTSARCGLPIKPTAAASLRGVIFSRQFVDQLNEIQAEVGASPSYRFEPFIGKPVWILIYARPIQRIIYYIGEVVRRRIDPEFTNNARSIQVKLGPAHLPIPRERCGGGGTPPEISAVGFSCVDLFVLNPGVTGSSTFSVEYEGSRYSIPADRQEAGYSYSVLALVRQLLATSTSEKAVPPSTTILTVAPAR